MKLKPKKNDNSKRNRIISINLRLLNSEQLKRISELNINFHKGLKNSLEKGVIYGRFTILTINYNKEYSLSEKLENSYSLMDFIDFFNEFHLFKNSGVNAAFSDLDGHLEYFNKSKNVILTKKPKDENIYIDDLNEHSLIGLKTEISKSFIIKNNNGKFLQIINKGYLMPSCVGNTGFKTIEDLIKKNKPTEVLMFNNRFDLFEWLSKD